MDAFHLQCDGGENTKHPISADHGVEQIRVLFGRAGYFCAGWQCGGKFHYMLTDGAHLEIILAVDVRAETTAQRRAHRTGYNRRPPPFRLDLLPKFFQCDAGFASHQAGSWIPFQNLIHAGHIEHDTAAIESSIVITASRAAGSDGKPFLLGKFECRIDLFAAARFYNVCRRIERVTKVFELSECCTHSEFTKTRQGSMTSARFQTRKITF